jgi:hypothetical protein
MLSRSFGSLREDGAPEPCVELVGEAVAGLALVDGLFPILVGISGFWSTHSMARCGGTLVMGPKKTRCAHPNRDEIKY